VPKIKLSENIGKITNPGYKKLYRFYDKDTGYALGDLIALYDEVIPNDGYTLINPVEEWKTKDISNYVVRELQETIIKNGKLVYELPSIEESRKNLKKELSTMYPEVKRFHNPHEYYVDLSRKLLELKKDLISGLRKITQKGK